MAEGSGELPGYAVGIAISPVPIIAVILMLFSAQACTNAPAFLVGWLLGIAAVAAIVLLVLGTAPCSFSWAWNCSRRSAA